MSRRTPGIVRIVLVLAGLYAAALLLGFALLVAAFQLGILARLDILFYRGLVLVAASFVVTFALLAFAIARLAPAGLATRDAFAAAVLSLSLNLSFLVIVPVTVDRSISIFMLGQMAAHPEQAVDADAMAARFVQVYVGAGRQIDRRLHEQALSGNVERDGDGYKITRRGEAVIATARFVARLFDSHAGIIAPAPPAPAPVSPEGRSDR